MTAATTTSSVVRRQLGRRLRALRTAARKTHVDVSTARIAARNKLWKIERGRIAVRPGDVLALARLYGADAATVEELLALADATEVTNFQEHHDSGAVPEWTGIYGDLEAGAVAIHHYSSELIDGLVQTEAYARAVIAAQDSLSAEVVEQRVRFRLRRQQAFFDRPTAPGRLRFVMPEGVLNLLVGSAAAMEEQIAHLRAVAQKDEVGIRILSARDGVHAAMNGPFRIMDFDDPDDPPLVYLETFLGSHYIERPRQVSAYRVAFEGIWEQASPLREYLE